MALGGKRREVSYRQKDLLNMKNELLEKYIKGETSPSENELIGQWLSEDDNRVKELTTMRRFYETMLWQQPQEEPRRLSPPIKHRSIYHHPALKVAAIIIVLLTVGNLFLLNKQQSSSTVAMQTLYVPAGQRAQITLADGTKVWLNALSTLTFPTTFNSRTRDVELSGEGFFDVTSNKHHPFIVHTQKHNIRVLGTKFNVSSYRQTNYFETSLLEGCVEILDSAQTLQTVLKPGTKVIAYHNGQLKKSAISNYDYYLWKDGLICFDEISVDKLFTKLELYYDIQIVVQKKSIVNKTFSGKLRVCDGVNHALEVIRTHTPFDYTRDEEKNVIIIK